MSDTLYWSKNCDPTNWNPVEEFDTTNVEAWLATQREEVRAIARTFPIGMQVPTVEGDLWVVGYSAEGMVAVIESNPHIMNSDTLAYHVHHARQYSHSWLISHLVRH